jgi:predicted signal transduction protein with EAL and GGDEF domain
MGRRCASIGIACAPRHGVDRDELPEQADASMYVVKQTGKNNYAMAMANDEPRRGRPLKLCLFVWPDPER